MTQKINAGYGYRLLNEGETIQEGDQFEFIPGEWHTISGHDYGVAWKTRTHVPCRRKIDVGAGYELVPATEMETEDMEYTSGNGRWWPNDWPCLHTCDGYVDRPLPVLAFRRKVQPQAAPSNRQLCIVVSATGIGNGMKASQYPYVHETLESANTEGSATASQASRREIYRPGCGISMGNGSCDGNPSQSNQGVIMFRPATEFKDGEEGIFLDLPAETYHKAPGVSNSMLKHLDPPANLPVYLAEKHEPTPAQIIGTLTHHRVLEPNRPLPRIVVPPETYPAPADCSAVKQKKAQPGDLLPWHWGAKYCKRWYAEAVESGLLVLTQAEFDTVNGCAEAIAADPVCKEIFREGHSEVSVFHRQETPSGTVLRKARLDWVPTGNTLVDTKTALGASKVEFSKAIADSFYYRQAAYYLDIWNAANPDDPKDCFVFVAVEKKAPFLVAKYDLSQKAINHGRDEYLRLLNLYGYCSAMNEWPGYPQEIQPICLPDWVYRKVLI